MASERRDYSFDGVFAAKGADVLYVNGQRATGADETALLAELEALRRLRDAVEDDVLADRFYHAAEGMDYEAYQDAAWFDYPAYRAALRAAMKGGEP